MKRIRITYWGPGKGGQPFPSQYGVLTFAEWCRREQERARRTGRQFDLVERRGQIALARV
jgi:hypothetical protein